MKMIRKLSPAGSMAVNVAIALAAPLCLITSVAKADSINPNSFAATLAVGGSTTITKTVTITPSATGLVDVFFFADTTGSMGGSLANVRNNLSSILNAPALAAANVQFGVGEYKDQFDGAAFGDDAFNLITQLTANKPNVQTGINALAAGGGGDLPEGQIPALVAASNLVNWRAGSSRLLIWFGDAPGHDPRLSQTEALAIAALNAKNVDVIAVNVTSGPGLNQTGQAQRIADATGGSFEGTATPSELVDTILDAITGSVSNYSEVCLDTSDAPAGVTVTTDPCITGTFDRSVSRDFLFDVTFTGNAPGVYSFGIDATVDGAVVATEADRINVGGVTAVPAPATVALLGLGLGFLALRRRVRAN